MAALKLNEVERVLTGCTQLTTILFECCWLVSWSCMWHNAGTHSVIFTKLKGDVTSVFMYVYIKCIIYSVYPSWPN